MSNMPIRYKLKIITVQRILALLVSSTLHLSVGGHNKIKSQSRFRWQLDQHGFFCISVMTKEKSVFVYVNISKTPPTVNWLYC